MGSDNPHHQPATETSARTPYETTDSTPHSEIKFDVSHTDPPEHSHNQLNTEPPSRQQSPVETCSQDRLSTHPIARSDYSHNPSPPKPGTLISELFDFDTALSPTWEYDVQQRPKTGEIHCILTNGSPSFCLYQSPQSTKTEWVVRETTERTHTRFDPSSARYTTFEAAFAALVETIDWGSLPPGNETPGIWTYSGYDGSTSFETYLSGHSYRTRGQHRLENTKAGYRVLIETFTGNTDATPTHSPVTTLSIEIKTRNDGFQPVFRHEFSGQQPAFNWLFTALDTDLSSTIALHNGDIGNTDRIPPYAYFTANTNK